MKQYLVFGAGRFGSGIVQELSAQNVQVVVCDSNERVLDEIDHLATHSIIGDFRDSEALDELNVEQFDAVFVAIGTDAYSAILITKKLKDRKAKRIIVKATSVEVGEILKSLGADHIIFPEYEAGVKIARQELMTGVKEYFEVTKDISAVEMEVPKIMVGQSLSSMDFSKKTDLTVSLIIRDGKPFREHFADVILMEGDQILIVGENKKIQRFKRKYK
ncbi:MAG: potassium channel family protein [Bacillus sp. (in: firmicutes)]